MGILRFVALAIVAGTLAGCDDGPEIRRNFAQCQIEERGTQGLSSYDRALRICMQSRGFVLDLNNENALGYPCRLIEFSAMEPRCFRRDSWLSGVLAKANQPRS